ncbi:hypothetical protein [Methanobacterium oryzae]|uniref:hypothetical protein n=1 Tax=Methanobacterium oryzae TaxID=69540 RepID=UPI003D21BE77
MSRNDKISILIAIIFLSLSMYFLYVGNYLYALGWIILSIAFFLEAYNPHETGRREVTIIINVILPFIGIGILIYALVYGN